MLFGIAVGVCSAVLLILYAARRGPTKENGIFAAGLVVTALLYVLFALVGGASPNWIALEIAGVFPFALFAFLGTRRSPLWLALGWLLHVAWDVGLHLGAHAPDFVSPFFPTFCIGFDLVVAGWIVARARTIHKALA